MAAASATAGNKYQSSTGLYIVTYAGDVTKAQADGIVVSEGRSFREMEYVALTLVSMDSEFDTNRNKLIQKEKAHFTPWRVYTTGSCAEFLSVFHAIVIPRGEKQPIQEWKGKMTSLYKKILQEAEKKGIHILAVPLLGSCKGNVKSEEAVEVAVRAMFSYKRKSLVKVLLVSDSEDIVDQLAIQCAYNSSAKGGKPLSQRPPPNIKTEHPLPQPPSSNAKSKSKLGRGTDSSWSSPKRQNGDRSDSSRNSDNNGNSHVGSGDSHRERRTWYDQGDAQEEEHDLKTRPERTLGGGNSHVESEYSHRERRTLYDQDVQKEILKTRPERTRGGRNHHVGRGNSYSGSGYCHSERRTWYDQGDAQEEEHDLKTRPERTLGGWNSHVESEYSHRERRTLYNQDFQKENLKTRPERTLGGGNSHVESEYSHRERRTLYDQDVQKENLKTRPERTRGGRNHHVGRGNSYSGSGYRHSERGTWYDQGDAQEEEHDLKTRPERTQGIELKRANGQAGKAYYETEMGGHDEPKALQHCCDISGGAIPKIKNKAQHNDVDDDDNVVKHKRRFYDDDDDDDDDDDEEEEDDEHVNHRYGDDDDHNGGGGAAADDGDAKTIKRLEHPQMMRGDRVISGEKSEEGAVLNTDFKDVTDFTTGEQMPYRNKKGFSEEKMPRHKTSGHHGTSRSPYPLTVNQGDAQEEENDLKTRPERTRGGRGNSYSGSGYRHSEKSTLYDQDDAQEEEHDLKTRPERTHENVVKQKRLAPQRRIYEEEDDDEINDDDDNEEEEEDTSEQENTGGHVGGRIENQEQHRRELATTSTESATVSAHIPRPPSPEDEMKEQLSCPVCLDLFTDPVILQPCCHSLCSECAETIRSPKSSFKCPMCLAVVQNGPLQRNFHLKGTVSIYKRQRKISNSMN